MTASRTETASLVEGLPGAVSRAIFDHEDHSRLVQVYWTGRGGGKTTFLQRLHSALHTSHRDQVAIVGPLDVTSWMKSSDWQGQLPSEQSVAKTGKAKRHIILIDNIDVLLRRDEGKLFFEFEHDAVEPLVARDVIFVFTSRSNLDQWREPAVRDRLHNEHIPALTREQVKEVAAARFRATSSLDAQDIYDLTLGYPQFVMWLCDQDVPKDEFARRTSDYLLEDVPSSSRISAELASLLPVFNVVLLRQVSYAVRTGNESQDQHADFLGDIRAMMTAGLLYWDIDVGGYRFSDSIVRQVIANGVRQLNHEDFTKAHKVAADYFKSEARRSGFLHLNLVNAIYHICSEAMMQRENPGMLSADWVKRSSPAWVGADWPKVLQAWLAGAGDVSVVEDIRAMIGADSFVYITELLEQARREDEAL